MRRRIFLLLLLTLALALRLWLWSRPDHPLANDETEYLPVAMDLAHGRGFVFYDTYRWLRAPLYPLFLAFFLWIGGDNLRVATMAQVLLSTATVAGFYLLTRRLFPGPDGERAGLAAAFMAALLLPFATFPALFMSETLFTFLFVAFLLAILQVPEAPGGQRWRWAAGAGGLLGLCALTRAVGLAFLPLAALWLFCRLHGEQRGAGVVRAGRARREPAPSSGAGGQPPGYSPPGRCGASLRESARRVALPLLFLLTGLGTIAPWTVRNAIAYRRFIPLDTGASFSLWAFYEPYEELEEIHRQLEAIPNPADRQAYAVGKGLERLREDPAILLRKIVQTFPYLFRVKPIEDRFLKIPFREPSLAYFVLGLLLDDGLYVLITVAALVAFFAPAGRGKALAVLWLLYNIAVMALLHPEARYRQLLFPVMIPYAALTLTQGGRRFSVGKKGLAWRAAGVALILSGWGYCLVTYSPWDWAWDNLRRGYHQAAGQMNWVLARPEAALQCYTRAIEVDERNPEPYYDLAWALEHLGRVEEAAAVYRRCWGVRINYLPCSTALGNILREAGQKEEAREAFLGRYVAEQDVVAWAWEHLDVSPVGRLDIGDGLDYGYVEGVHATEAAGGVSYRWTSERARLRLAPAASGSARLRLRVAAPRLGGSSPVPVVVWADGQRIARWEVGPDWTTLETSFFPSTEGRTVEVLLQSDTFVPQRADPASPDTRSLGVQLDWAEMVTGITGSVPTVGYHGLTPFP